MVAECALRISQWVSGTRNAHCVRAICLKLNLMWMRRIMKWLTICHRASRSWTPKFISFDHPLWPGVNDTLVPRSFSIVFWRRCYFDVPNEIIQSMPTDPVGVSLQWRRRRDIYDIYFIRETITATSNRLYNDDTSPPIICSQKRLSASN